MDKYRNKNCVYISLLISDYLFWQSDDTSYHAVNFKKCVWGEGGRSDRYCVQSCDKECTAKAWLL